MQFHTQARIEDVAALRLTSAAQTTPVAEIMTRDVVCVTPETSAREVAQVLLLHSISGVPVIDAEGRPLGIVSKTDILCALGPNEESVQASDIMTPITLAMPSNASIARAAALMAYERVHRVIIVAPSGVVVGLVSSIDVLHWHAKHDGYSIP